MDTKPSRGKIGHPVRAENRETGPTFPVNGDYSKLPTVWDVRVGWFGVFSDARRSAQLQTMKT